MQTRDFSAAGCRRERPNLPVIPAAEFGIRPGGGDDLSATVNRALNELGTTGGGILCFEAGEYGFDSPIRLDHANLVLRGEGPSTLLRLRRPQTQNEFSPWLSPALITAGAGLQGTEKFWGVKPARPIIEPGLAGAGGIAISGDLCEAPFLSAITKVLSEQEFEVAAAAGIQGGDFVLVTMRNTDESGTLLRRLLGTPGDWHPLQRSVHLAGPSRAASFQYLAEIASVNDRRIKLTSPLPEPLEMEFEPALYAAPLLTGLGVENLRLGCDWRGPYLHHGGNLYPYEAGNEMDYGWSAIKFFRSAHSLIHQVVIEDLTSGVELIDCRNVTVRDLLIRDHGAHGGHYGVKVYCHCSGNLFRDIRLEACRTHGISCEGNSYGNVFSHFTVTVPAGEPAAEFDLHGFADLPFAPPGHNLFEHITGIGRITGGGGKYNLPHSGRGNIFRDIEFNVQDDELFYSWISEDTGEPDYRQFPGTVLDGVRSPGRTLRINGSSGDRREPSLEVRRLNQRYLEESTGDQS